MKYGLPAAAVVFAAMTVYHVVRTQPGDKSVPPPIAPAKSPFAAALAVRGLVEPRGGPIAVAAPVPGIVAEVFVQVGQQVSPSAPLFRLDDRPLRAELRMREAQLATAKARLARLDHLPREDEAAASLARVAEARASLAVQQARLERAQKQLKDKLISSQEVDELRQAVAAARERVTAAQAEDRMLRGGAWEQDKAIARAAVAEAEAFLAQGQTEFKRLTVGAPVKATVLQVNIRGGESVGARSDAAPIVLGDIQSLQVRVEIPEEQITRWRPEAPAQAVPRGERQSFVNLRYVREEPLVVSRQFLRADPRERSDTRVLQVIYEFDVGQAPIRVGQQMDVFISAEL